MEDCSYMCGECFQVYDNIDAFNKHVCHSDMDAVCGPQDKPSVSSQKELLPVMSPPAEGVVDSPSGKTVSPSHKGDNILVLNIRESSNTVAAVSDREETQDEEEGKAQKTVRKRKKYRAMDDTYRLNRTMRDKDFKLNRSHFYCFKDTLGDWDERSTQLLLRLIHKYPKTHFLLVTKTEKRMEHWENLHKQMESTGYTFTILQLRMRWREALQKYRWTVDYNHRHEIKKRCEYFDQMNELFGDWDKDATHCLLKQMHRVKRENQNKKIVRIGYSGWEKITESLNSEGHRFTINMVEGRWRNMVTLYKTTVDYNFIPNVEPRSIAYKKDMEELVKYVPQRRHNYEKRKGRSVKMERFPTNGSKALLQAYKDCISRFMDPTLDNRNLWDEITQKLDDDGFHFTTFKLKEILNGMIKGFEKCQFHNSLPGAIRRDVPYYRDLAEIYDEYGRWPHTQISRTMEMRTSRKFRLRLQVSQQLWSAEESRALLQVYPDVLESHVSQNLSHQTSDLWLQVAKAYAATGFPKRDVPEIAIHFGLLHQGYTQGNRFPFVDEMRRVKETEEAICYSPDVSKFTGDEEITYWSHEAVNHLLDLYLQYQAAASSSHGCKEEVFIKIKDKMQELGYGYTSEQVYGQFKTLLTQYNTRKMKPWSPPRGSRKVQNPVGAPYWEKLHKVLNLRKSMSLSWTTGVKPLSLHDQKIVYRVACQKAEELLTKKMRDKEHMRLLAQITEGIRAHIRTNKLLDPVPHTRQVRLHLTDAIKNFDEDKEDNKDIIQLYMLLEEYDLLKLFHDGKQVQQKKNRSVMDSDEDCTGSSDLGWISEEEHSDVLNGKEKKGYETAVEYLAFNLSCLKVNLDKQKHGDADYVKMESSGSYPDCEKTVQVAWSCLKDSGTIESHISGMEKITSENCLRSYGTGNICDQSEVQNVLSSSVKEELAKKYVPPVNENCDVTQDSGDSSAVDDPLPSCSGSDPREQIKLINTEKCADIYKNLFRETHSTITKSCSKQGKGAFYTFSERSHSDLVLYLPKELTLNTNNKVSNRRQCDVQKQKRKRKCHSDKDFSSNSCDSETGTVVNEELLSSETDDCFHHSQKNIKDDPETKVIQTRSGRKTRFTFFSKALNDNSDDDFFNESTPNSSENNTPEKRPKLNLPSSESLIPHRKRGRPRKKETDTVLSYKILGDGSAFIHLDSSENMTSETSRLKSQVSFVDKNHKCMASAKDSVMTFFEEHQSERVKTEVKLLNVLKDQQVEQAGVLTEMLSIFKDMQCKLKVKE